tara:strand:+ start:65 stop:391 length:327 start_codon:yes stop_codon:yes gene_type:complete
MPKKTLTLHIESEILDNFRNYCKLNALKVSAKIELLLKQEMENAKSNPTLVQMFKEILENKKIEKAATKPNQVQIQYAPKTNISDIIQEVKKKNKTPTIDQLRYRRSL